MCGIAGLVSADNNVSERMIAAENIQSHRGPDAKGIKIFESVKWKIGLGHQRLSILDLSSAGDQPMSSPDKKGWIVYNGEVYNYREIRDELKSLGHSFTSDSDTEVVLTALHQWGPAEAFNRFNGMWALAWLDMANNKLILARDRVGVKPLNYYIDKKEVYFASELKGVLALSTQKFRLNYQVVGEYLQQSLLETSNDTFFEGIRKVPAGHFAVIDLLANNLSIEMVQYWSLNRQASFEYSEDILIERIREIFLDAVRLRLRSDVPVGVLLSGGVDSSAIVAAMKSVLGTSENLNLLSAVSKDPRFDESYFIDVMARHLGCEVTKVVLDFNPEEAFNLLEEVCWYNDEPVGSFANVAHYLLMKKAKELGVTVILSGQGADELLCGYKKYLGFYLQQLFTEGNFIKAAQTFQSFYRQGTIINQFSFSEAKRYLPSFLRSKEIDICGPALREYIRVPVGMQRCNSVIDRQCLDIERFSVPVLVHYEDRMSMAWSREIRVPFLDYRLVEMLVPMAIDRKLSHGWTKYIFRKALEPMLPQEIAWRKDKQGFVNPQSEWLKNELREQVLARIGADSLISKFGLVDKDKLAEKYSLFCRQRPGEGNIFFIEVFNPLALEIWLKRFAQYIA